MTDIIARLLFLFATNSVSTGVVANVIATVAALVSGIGLFLIWRTLGQAVDANRLAAPPFLKIMQVSLPLTESRLSGQCLIINAGRSAAYIQRAELYVWVTDKPLPQIHPTLQANPSQNPLRDAFKKAPVLPGHGDYWQYLGADGLTTAQIQSLEDPDGLWKLYVLGVVRYLDARGANHHTLFCQKYDPTRKRFRPVSNPDYEHHL